MAKFVKIEHTMKTQFQVSPYRFFNRFIHFYESIYFLKSYSVTDTNLETLHYTSSQEPHLKIPSKTKSTQILAHFS